MFKRAQLDSLCLEGLTDSFVMRNLLRFYSDNSSMFEFPIDSNITTLCVMGYKFDLDDQLLSKLVFGNLVNMQVISSVSSIQEDLFFSTPLLETVLVEMGSLRNFFHKIGLDWTISLPTGT